MAELLRRRREGQGHDEGRRLVRDAAHRGDLRSLRRPSGTPLSGWPPSDRHALLHQLGCSRLPAPRRPQPRVAAVRDNGILAADSVARRINRESFLLLGGTAALLMQVAHPLVAAGVDQHSDFRRSPLRRLVRTVNTTLAIVFGERATAKSALKRIGRSHALVRGQAADGRAYRARDPRLLLWVQTTLVLTSVRWYEAVMGRLSQAERDAYWAEGKFFAGELGVPKELFPPTYADLE